MLNGGFSQVIFSSVCVSVDRREITFFEFELFTLFELISFIFQFDVIMLKKNSIPPKKIYLPYILLKLEKKIK